MFNHLIEMNINNFLLKDNYVKVTLIIIGQRSIVECDSKS